MLDCFVQTQNWGIHFGLFNTLLSEKYITLKFTYRVWGWYSKNLKKIFLLKISWIILIKTTPKLLLEVKMQLQQSSLDLFINNRPVTLCQQTETAKISYIITWIENCDMKNMTNFLCSKQKLKQRLKLNNSSHERHSCKIIVLAQKKIIIL